MKVTIKGFLCYSKWAWNDVPTYELWPFDASKTGDGHRALIREQYFEVDIPDDFDPRPQQIAVLKAKKQEILAEAHVKATNIDEQISRLLCIENKVDV